MPEIHHPAVPGQGPGPSRRTVLRAATLGAGAALGSGLLGPLAAGATTSLGTYDLVVIGSGAAGMTAALRAAKRGLSVVVVEKAPTFGGTTARSGAGIWLPNNSVILAAGVPDTPAKAAEYLAAVVGSDVPADRQAAFLNNGAPMLDFVMANSPCTFQYMPGYSDYYPELPGGMPNGRSIEPGQLDGHILGSELANLNPPYAAAPAGTVIFDQDYKWLQLSLVNATGVARALEIVARGTKAALLGQAPLSMGQALAAGLRAGLQQANVPVWLNTPLVSLNVANGAVTGVTVTHNGSQGVISARGGVLVAAGGFDHNLPMRAQYQQAPVGQWSVGAKENTGDGINAGIAAGAATALMDDAWWGPGIPLPGGPWFMLAERTEPGSIMVDAAGQRFMNEGAPYVDAVHAMYKHNSTTQDIPCWLVFDQNYRDRYLFQEQAPALPLPQAWYDAGVAFQSWTISGLASQIGVPAANLQATISRFNGFARTGVDTDFHRGVSVYDHYYTDPAVTPNSCLAPLRLAPYYAIKVVPSDLGTKGGLLTDARARVVRPDGSVIPGLYAAGNSSAAVMGHSYAGAGSTIGPAMTFGYIAANDVATALGK
jgi:3-oxosteroid 1-dehydrogenase